MFKGTARAFYSYAAVNTSFSKDQYSFAEVPVQTIRRAFGKEHNAGTELPPESQQKSWVASGSSSLDDQQRPVLHGKSGSTMNTPTSRSRSPSPSGHQSARRSAPKHEGSTSTSQNKTENDSHKKSRKMNEIKKIVIKSDPSCDVIHLPGQSSEEEKVSFVLLSDDRIATLQNCWNSKSPMIHIIGKMMVVKDIQEDAVKVLQELLQRETLSQQKERLVVVIAVGTYDVLLGCHDAEIVLDRLLDLKDAIQETLPPGSIALISPLPRLFKKHLRKELSDKVIVLMNDMIIEYYKTRVSSSVQKWLFGCVSTRFDLVMKEREAVSFVKPLEEYFKYFSAMKICSLCLSSSSALSKSNTKESYCMVCDRCLRQLSNSDLTPKGSTSGSTGNGKCKRKQQESPLQTTKNEKFDNNKIQKIQKSLKESVSVVSSLSDALAVLLVLSFDKRLYLLYKKVLHEEENKRNLMSTCSYNEIVLLGLTGERAANALTFMPEDQRDLFKNVVLMIKATLETLANTW